MTMTYFLAKDTNAQGRICLFEGKPDKVGNYWFPHGDNGVIDVSVDSLPTKDRDTLIEQIKVEPIEVEIRIDKI